MGLSHAIPIPVTTVVVFGIGGLGNWALEFLARTHGIDRIVAVTRSGRLGAELAAMAAIGSLFQHSMKSIEHRVTDITDVSTTARFLEEVRPDAVLNTATFQSPRLLMNAPAESRPQKALKSAPFGVWLPWHLLPALRLLQAVESSGIETHVVNAAFPDVVNPVLWNYLGRGPTTGAGNAEITAAALTKVVAEREGVSHSEVEVSLIGSHALFAFGPRPEIPYFIRVLVKGKDVTDLYRLETMAEHGVDFSMRGVPVFSVFAASAVKNIEALLIGDGDRTHICAPNGLPGAYPGVIAPSGVRLTLPKSITHECAVEINRAGNRFDGIDFIEDDGTVIFSQQVRETMGWLGYSHTSVAMDQLGVRCEELQQLFQRVFA